MISYLEGVSTEQFPYIMPEAQLFFRTIAQSLDFIVIDDKITVWVKLIISCKSNYCFILQN